MRSYKTGCPVCVTVNDCIHQIAMLSVAVLTPHNGFAPYMPITFGTIEQLFAIADDPLRTAG
jgi:hypothetical protein